MQAKTVLTNGSTLPHGVWPSPDSSLVYINFENHDAVQVIDTTTRAVVATVKVGQMPQALVYVANAVPAGEGTAGLTQQNVNLKITSQKFLVGSTGEAEVVVRELEGGDSVDVTAKRVNRGCKVQGNRCLDIGRAAGYRSLQGGCNRQGEGQPPNLSFFDAGYTSVTVIPAS
jgi:YVTN family beta-propeller protein